jgi:hypothetical protein
MKAQFDLPAVLEKWLQTVGEKISPEAEVEYTHVLKRIFQLIEGRYGSV